MARSVSRAAVVGVGTGVVHFLAHNRFGEPGTFARAGVMEAGAAVIVAAAALSLAVGQQGELTFQGVPESRAERARRRLNPRGAA